MLYHFSYTIAHLQRANLADSTFDGTFVFRTDIADADLSTAAIRSVHADQVKWREVKPLNYADIRAID